MQLDRVPLVFASPPRHLLSGRSPQRACWQICCWMSFGSTLIGLASCSMVSSQAEVNLKPTPPAAVTANSPSPSPTAASPMVLDAELFQQSWVAYRERFIQADGRVIDREDRDRSTSEGQAYALLRAVLVDDPATFAKVLQWSENNLQRKTNGQRSDQLWVWKWGQDDQEKWGVLDPNFASDADVDAVTALIWAARRWNRPEYLQLARRKLKDLWTFSTVAQGDRRYFLPGPAIAFRQGNIVQLNPSYLAPYAFRLFAQVDPQHDWLSLVDSSYRILENSATLSAVSLPSDWVALNLETGEFQPLPLTGSLRTQYGFDAYRVWWRVAWDAELFKATPAQAFLRQHLGFVQTQWRSRQKIPAVIDLLGKPLVDYESTAQYAMLYPAFRSVDPAIAEQILRQKLQPQYRDGFWDNNSAYYTQNLAWLGLLPPSSIPAQLLRP